MGAFRFFDKFEPSRLAGGIRSKDVDRRPLGFGQ